MYSEQYLDEWISYQNVVRYCKQQHEAIWLDVKGNHGWYQFGNVSKPVSTIILTFSQMKNGFY